MGVLNFTLIDNEEYKEKLTKFLEDLGELRADLNEYEEAGIVCTELSSCRNNIHSAMEEIIKAIGNLDMRRADHKSIEAKKS